MKAKFIEMFRGVASYQIGFSWMVEVYDDFAVPRFFKSDAKHEGDFYPVNPDKVPARVKAATVGLHKDRHDRLWA